MKATAKELMKLGLWERFCKETGMDEWAINEGKLDPNELLQWEVLKTEAEGK